MLICRLSTIQNTNFIIISLPKNADSISCFDLASNSKFSNEDLIPSQNDYNSISSFHSSISLGSTIINMSEISTLIDFENSENNGIDK